MSSLIPFLETATTEDIVWVSQTLVSWIQSQTSAENAGHQKVTLDNVKSSSIESLQALLPKYEADLPLLKVSDVSIKPRSIDIQTATKSGDKAATLFDSLAHFLADLAYQTSLYRGNSNTRNRLAISLESIVHDIRQECSRSVSLPIFVALESAYLRKLSTSSESPIPESYYESLWSTATEKVDTVPEVAAPKIGMTSTTRPATVSSARSQLQGGITMILPAAGRSSRFPNMKPKWMLTQPNGRLMIVDAISAIEHSKIQRVVLGILKEHLQQYCGGDVQGVITSFDDGEPWLREVELTVLVLDQQTQDQVQTIECILHGGDVTGPVFIKDSDNKFECIPEASDAIASLKVYRENEEQVYNIASKGFLSFDTERNLTSVIEKVMISNQICVGAYSFADAQQGLQAVASCRYVHAKYGFGKSEIALSDVFWHKLLTGDKIKALESSGYEDWGTLTTWRHFCSSWKTLFVDIDGTLVKNSGQYFQPMWGSTGGLPANIKRLQDLYKLGRTRIILTTSRTEAFKEATEEQLKRLEVPYDQILFGLLHAQRVVINDFAPTNPYPTGLAINLNRNAEDLAKFL